MIITTLLLAPMFQAGLLQVQGEQAPQWVADLPRGHTRVLVPQTAYSPRVARASAGPRGFEFQVGAPKGVSLELEALLIRRVPHRFSERVLLFGEELRIVSDCVLPSSARRSAMTPSCLGLLARQDQVGLSQTTVSISAGGPNSDLVLLPMAAEEPTWSIEARIPGGEWAGLTGKSLAGHALRLDGSTAWELRLGSTGLDQAFHAASRALTNAMEQSLPSVTFKVASTEEEHRPPSGRGPSRRHMLPQSLGHELDSQASTRLRLKAGEMLRSLYPVPRGAGETFTFLVDLRLGGVSNASQAEASARFTPAPLFRDVAGDAGLLDVHFEGPLQQRDIRPTMGPGAAWGDFDGDGLVDLYLVQGGGRAGSTPPKNRLMRNLGDGTFQAAPGAENEGAGMGAIFFDLEGDGDLDLYVANYGPDALYRNDGADGFAEVSASHSLASSEWSAGLCAGDFDGDGDVDLYVTSYLVYDPALMPPVEELPGYFREDPIEMLPFAFPGARNTFLENVDGTLVDRTETLGLFDEQGRGMQPVFWDFDLDGDLDLYIANDVSMNVLLRNEGDGTFKDISFQVGMDDPRGGMGVTTGDVDLDGDADLFLTNWQLEANALYRNNHISRRASKSHMGTFQDVTVHSKLARNSIGTTSWGAVLFDADNDGDLDLFVPNGYTSPDYESTGICVGQPNQLFLNDGTGRFEDVSASSGPAILEPLSSRSAALCDYDRDGRLDLFITNNNGPYQLLHNEVAGDNHWLGFTLRGRGKNSTAIGARVELEVGGVRLARTVKAGSGYLAGHAAEVHFGLGQAEAVGQLRIQWPSGATSTHTIEALDRWSEIKEPEPR